MSDVIIIDDHPIMRRGLAQTLEEEIDLQVAAQMDTAEEALEALEESAEDENEEELAPDLAIVDLSLPGMSGLELIKHLRATRPELPTLVVSRHDETLYAERALRAGARGYLMKLEAGEVIVEAAREVLKGGIYVSDEINERLLRGMVGSDQEQASASPLEALSDRELEVFEAIGRGRTTQEIAEKLLLSPKTVGTYRTRIKEKLSLDTTAELKRRAILWVETEDL